MEKLQADANEPIKEFINKYPLTVAYFQDKGLAADNFTISLEEFAEKKNLSMDELEDQLLTHLFSISRPESQCSITCFSNLDLCTHKIIVGVIILVMLGLIAWWLI